LPILGYLFLLLLLIPYIVWYIMKGQEVGCFSSSVRHKSVCERHLRVYKLRLLHLFLSYYVSYHLHASSFLSWLVLSRRTAGRDSETEGIDIMMCLDVRRRRMLARRYSSPNRIQAADRCGSKLHQWSSERQYRSDRSLPVKPLHNVR
jgi:Ca-activated chloride channel family protein